MYKKADEIIINMKKILVSLCSLLATVTMVSAQDINQATDLFNNAVSYYSAGNLDSAIDSFHKALDIAKKCGEDGIEIATDCETYIPQLGEQLAKDYAADGKYPEAIAKLKEISALCNSLGLKEDAAKLEKKIPQFYMLQGSQAVKDKKYAEAITAFDNVLAIDPANGKAALLKGQVLEASGKIDDAQAAYELALANGQEKAAKRQLTKTYLKEAKAASGAKNYTLALSSAKKAISYDSTEANAYYIGGIAAQNLNKDAEAISMFEKYLELKPAASNSQAVRQVVEALKKGKK